MTTVRAKSDLSLSQAIPYSFSPPRSSGESSPRDQDSHGEESPHHTPSRAFYIPAGSVSSHEGDSLSDTQEVSHPPMDLRIDDSEPLPGFQPTSDNVIVFEVYTPPSQALPSQRHTSKKFLFSEDVCFQILEERDSPKFEERPLSSADALAPMAYSEDEEELPQVSRSDKNVEVAKLQEMLRNAASENDKLRSELAAKDTRIQALETQKKAKPETSSKQTSTSFEDSSDTQRFKREIEQLNATCVRYERQNQDLRQEVQTCTTDLTNTEKEKGKLAKELKRLNQLVSTYEGEMTRIAGFVAKVLAPDTEETWEDKDPRHVSNYLASKVEIISSRHSRLQAMHENKLEECEKLRQDLQTCRAALKTLETQSEDAVKQLTGRLKTKESIIQKLEGRVKGKESGIEQMKPRNQTENFTSLLRGLTENRTPPRKATQGAFKPILDSAELEDITEKPCVESDEELYVSQDRSHSNGRHELNKTETPVQVKRQVWKQETGKPPHIRTQSYMHSLLSSDSRGPVLTYKEALKDLREISTRASRAIEESSLTRMQVRESHAQEGKSSSADRRRKQKETGTSLRTGVKAEELKARKYRPSYVSAALKW